MDPDGRDDPVRPDGRHRVGGRVLAWAPGLTDSDTVRSEGARPDAARSDATRSDAARSDTARSDAARKAGQQSDPQDDSPPRRRPQTLGDLDLAITPVSVTPPPTWRRAAWFSVGASCVVLTVLVFAAALLAERPFDRIDAFPGLPTGGLLTAQPLGPPVHPVPAGPPGAGGDGHTALGGQPGDGQGNGGPLGSDGSDDSDGRSSPGSAGPTGEQARGDAPTAPMVTVMPTTGQPPPVTAEDLVAGTTRFYDQLPRNVDAAWAMVGPRVKVQGYDSFRKLWGDATEVRLQQIVVDADGSSVLATVQLVTADGVEHVQRFHLTFRKGRSMIIDDITPVTGDGVQQPVG